MMKLVGDTAIKIAAAARGRLPRRVSIRAHAIAPGWLMPACIVLCSNGCQRSSIPDPDSSVRAYVAAAEAGDADAIYTLMSKDAQRRYGKQGVRKRVGDARPELKEHARALRGPTKTEAKAIVRYVDGEQAELVLENGELHIGSAGALPSLPTTPAAALAELRQALARRSYSALVRVLSADTRSRIEKELTLLVEALEHPETLDIRVEGNEATVVLAAGHQVKLKREGGAWRIDGLE